jgi:hypothetical protein
LTVSCTIVRRAAVVAAATVALAGTSSAPASAATVYCSPTGDFCLGAIKRDGVRRLTLRTFSFGGRIQVCVTTPAGQTQCRRFRLRRDRDLWVMDARWSSHFANDGPGTYRVRFRYGGSTLGEPVAFPVR